MTVKELVEELLKLPQDAEVYVLDAHEEWGEPHPDLRPNGDVHL